MSTLVIASIGPASSVQDGGRPGAQRYGLVPSGAMDRLALAAANTLVFTNTRSQCERWFQAMLDARPDWAGLIALHHGSLDKSVREWVEAGLKAGSLKAVVATSSLDLGVDSGDVGLSAPLRQVLHVVPHRLIARGAMLVALGDAHDEIVRGVDDVVRGGAHELARRGRPLARLG